MQGQQKPPQSKIKNPLLASSVTGLTYDDYVHNTILLPAAPQFVRKEPEPDIRGPVIFSPTQLPGTAPILDTENFSEISLDQNAPELQTISPEYNPLQDIDSEPKQDTILDQATASFAQLPAVASTVFTTFSNIIKGSTSTSPPPVQIPQSQPQAQAVPFLEPQFDNFYSSQPSQYSYPTAEPTQTAPTHPPPTFFSPTDPSILRNTPREAPETTGGNTYRLGGQKKKTYAHIPGLNTGPTAAIPTGSPNPVQASYQQLPPQPQPNPEPAQASSKFSLFEYIPKIASLPKIPSFSIDKKQEPENYWKQTEEPLQSAFVPTYIGASFQPVKTEFFPQPSPVPTSPSELKPITSTPRTFNTGLPNQEPSPSLPPSGSNPNFIARPLSQSSFAAPQVQENRPIETSLSSQPVPTFYTPGQVPVVPNLPQHTASRNPYSSGKLRKGAGLYKNPLAPSQEAVPTYLPNQLPPSNLFGPTQPPVQQNVPLYNQPLRQEPQIVFNPLEQNPAVPPSNFFVPSVQPIVPKPELVGQEPNSVPLFNPLGQPNSINPLVPETSKAPLAAVSFYDPSNFFSQPIQPIVANQENLKIEQEVPHVKVKQEVLSETDVIKQEPGIEVKETEAEAESKHVSVLQSDEANQAEADIKLEPLPKAIQPVDPLEIFPQQVLPIEVEQDKEETKSDPHCIQPISVLDSLSFFQQPAQPTEIKQEETEIITQGIQQSQLVSVLDPTSFFQESAQQIVVKEEQKEILPQSNPISVLDPTVFFQEPVQPINLKQEPEFAPISEPITVLNPTASIQEPVQSTDVKEKEQDIIPQQSVTSTFFQQPTEAKQESEIVPQPVTVLDSTAFFQPPVQTINLKEDQEVKEPLYQPLPVGLKKEPIVEQQPIQFYNPSVYFNQNSQPIENTQQGFEKNNQISSVPLYDPSSFFNQSVQPVAPTLYNPASFFGVNVAEPPKNQQTIPPVINFFNPNQTSNFQPIISTQPQIPPSVPLYDPFSYINQSVQLENQPKAENLSSNTVEPIQEALQQLPGDEQIDGKVTDLSNLTKNCQDTLRTNENVISSVSSEETQTIAEIEDLPTLDKNGTQNPVELYNPFEFQSQEHLLVEQIPSKVQVFDEEIEEDDKIDDLQASQVTEQVEFLIGETPLRKSVSEDTPSSKKFPITSETSTPKHDTIANPVPNPVDILKSNFENLNVNSQHQITNDFFPTASQPQISASESQTFNFCNFFNQPVQQQDTSFFGPSAPISRTVTDSAFDESIGYVAPDNKSVEPEQFFRSDNLFDFKRNNFNDTSNYSKDVLLDENSIAPTMDTTNASASCVMASPNVAYRPVYKHWFYSKVTEGKNISIWTPFSMNDSLALEEAVLEDKVIHTDGGRYDVKLPERLRTPVYWNEPSNEVRQCSWFYKNLDSRYIPYEEAVADLLENEYKESAVSGEWHRKVALPSGDTVVFHGPSVMVHFLQTQNPDAWDSTVPQSTNRPRVVKRGVDEFNIEDGEPEQVDHILFMVHGIGEACDIKFRPVVEVVDDFRSIAQQLVQSHYRSATDRGDVGRVEILPISWHNELHSEESGIDKKLKSITLESIPKLRNFTNDTLLDVLFYTSPMFCQSIIDAVANSLNRLYTLFCQRNPNFHGGVSLAGHSLGSLILFDILCHQKKQNPEMENSENPDSVPPLISRIHRQFSRRYSQQINYEVGSAGTGQPYITYPQLFFQPTKFFALGSPIGMFVTIRGIDALGLDFELPTCSGFYNLFHPYDPVAYRVESLVNPELANVKPVLVPHHKGRKRMHLELKETMMRVGTDIKQKFMDTFKNTMEAVMAITSASKTDPKAIENEVDKVLESQMKFETGSNVSSSDLESGIETDVPLGQLNQSKRIDYVLQEAPLEFINEYLFALTSHVCYWDSEDTILFIMKEIYTHLGMQADSQLPQHTMTVERSVTSSPSLPTFSLLRQKESPDSKKSRNQ